MASLSCTLDFVCATNGGGGTIRVVQAAPPPGTDSLDGITFQVTVSSQTTGQNYNPGEVSLAGSFPVVLASGLPNDSYTVQLVGTNDEAAVFNSGFKTVAVACVAPVQPTDPGVFVPTLPKLVYHLRTRTLSQLVYHLRTGPKPLVFHLRTGPRQPLPPLVFRLRTAAAPVVYHLRTADWVAEGDGELCVQLQPTGERLLVQVPRKNALDIIVLVPPTVIVTSLDGSISYATELLDVTDDLDNWYFESDYLERDGVFIVEVLFAQPQLSTQLNIEQHVLVHLRLQFEQARILQTVKDDYNETAADIEMWLAAVVLVFEQKVYEEADYMLAELYNNLLLYPTP